MGGVVNSYSNVTLLAMFSTVDSSLFFFNMMRTSHSPIYVTHTSFKRFAYLPIYHCEEDTYMSCTVILKGHLFVRMTVESGSTWLAGNHKYVIRSHHYNNTGNWYLLLLRGDCLVRGSWVLARLTTRISRWVIFSEWSNS
ncbi:uncharacterized protein [Rutidosis leptorrhynchoides]|uniref:uncharacterized protein n=1 Tax=Rutidosis leptorrhynchoides TaxID=125765 RepID=UPI003A995647